MVDLAYVEHQVQQLSPSDLTKFRKWLREYEWQAWDRQIEHDSKSGKLKALAKKVLADHAAGGIEPLSTENIPHIGTMLHLLNTWNLSVRSELSSFL